METLREITFFVLDSLSKLWPYLLITIPVAVAVNVSGAFVFIERIFTKKPFISVILATAIGAFSPFCSCGVIPVISTLLIGGVPLAPVMSFWISSPTMDPEIFFLSSSVLGWNMAVWRLAATFTISLSAGLITLYLNNKGIASQSILKVLPGADMKSTTMCNCSNTGTRQKEILKEVISTTLMVLKFMVFSVLISALMKFLLPESLINLIISFKGPFAVVISAVAGIPVYTSNTTALPVIGNLISLGMDKGAALAFLIAGPATTIPALAAVWGIVKMRIFFLYLIYIFSGAVISGILYNIVF